MAALSCISFKSTHAYKTTVWTIDRESGSIHTGMAGTQFIANGEGESI
jgi:hypothetical protein